MVSVYGPQPDSHREARLEADAVTSGVSHTRTERFSMNGGIPVVDPTRAAFTLLGELTEGQLRQCYAVVGLVSPE